MLKSDPYPGLKFPTWLLLALLCSLTAAVAAGKSGDPNHPKASLQPDADDVIQLSPYVVEEDASTPWLVARIDGTEILSRCSKALTESLVNRYQRLNGMLALIYPAALQPEHDVPVILFIDEKQTNPLTGRVSQLSSGNVRSYGSPLPNFYRWDQDSRAIHFIFTESDDGRSPITITPAYLRYLLEIRSPALPRWFIEGLVTLHGTMVFPVPPVAERGTLTDDRTAVQFRPKYPYDKVTVLPFVWQSHEQTKQMHTLFKRTARATGRMQLPDSFPFLPLEKLLTTSSLAELNREEANIFPYQAALLIRWALDPKQQEQRKNQSPASRDLTALWQFVEQSAAEPFSARQFSAAFGESMDEVATRLKGYLPFACLDSGSFLLKPSTSPNDLVNPVLAPATQLEVSLIKGRSERLDALYVLRARPALADEFIQRARVTLNRGRPENQPHPGQLAELGLLEVDRGNDPDARPLLAQAAATRLAHPRVYLELARIEYDQLLKNEIDWSKPPEEIVRIEQLLRTCLEQRPALPGAYELLFDLWLQQNRAPTPEELLLLEKGPRLFSRHFRIIYAAALLQTAHGHKAQARLLIERSLPIFPSGKEHARLLQLQQTIGAEPSP